MNIQASGNGSTGEQPGVSGGQPSPFSGEPPIGMPAVQAKSAALVRDMLYLAAHDAAFASLPIERLTQMLGFHAASEQTFMIRRNDWPVAFAMWGHLSEEALRHLIAKGYGALQPSDLNGGDLLVLLGICCPWRREDFDVAFASCSGVLDDGTGNGGWYVVLPAVNDMPKRLTRFRRTGSTGGVLEEARL